MRRVTRNVGLDDARDLLERAPRACIGVAGDGGPQALPVVLLWRDGRYLVSVVGGPGARPSSGQEVVLLVDEGVHFFDLRAIYIRGRVKPAEAPVGAPARRAWFEVMPIKTVAWDYGKLREVTDEGLRLRIGALVSTWLSRPFPRWRPKRFKPHGCGLSFRNVRCLPSVLRQ